MNQKIKVKSIAIEITNNAFLPEAYAYHDYLVGKGFKSDLIEKGDPKILNYDAVVLFHGFHPFWKKYPKFVIGEYHSLSVGRFSRIKDFVKRLINVRANFYIFLNDEVRRKMFFTKGIPHVLRGMGFDKTHFEKYKGLPKIYDVIYAGSNRVGLVEKIEYLANLGLIVAVVGFEYPKGNKNVVSVGRVSPEEARRIISQSRFGLNFTPDVFPFNIQDSTKVIEYCGAGIGVITNRYKWVNEFELSRGARFLTLDDIKSKSDVMHFNHPVPNVNDLSWDRLSSTVFEGS